MTVKVNKFGLATVIGLGVLASSFTAASAAPVASPEAVLGTVVKVERPAGMDAVDTSVSLNTLESLPSISMKKVMINALSLNSDIEVELAKIRNEQAEQAEQARQALLASSADSSVNTDDTSVAVPVYRYDPSAPLNQDFLNAALAGDFTNFDVRTPSNLSAEALDRILSGSRMEGLGGAYMRAEHDFGVNALVLLGISVHESGWGTSRLANDRNNIFGYKAYDHNVDAAEHFSSKEDSIRVVASHLSRNYLTAGAKYFNGYTLSAMNVCYATDKNWASAIAQLMGSVAYKAL